MVDNVFFADWVVVKFTVTHHWLYIIVKCTVHFRCKKITSHTSKILVVVKKITSVFCTNSLTLKSSVTFIFYVIKNARQTLFCIHNMHFMFCNFMASAWKFNIFLDKTKSIMITLKLWLLIILHEFERMSYYC